MTTFSEFLKKNNVHSNGVLHLGAHLGEEAEEYDKLGIKNVIWIEGNPEIFHELEKNIAKYEGHQAHNLLISDKDAQEVKFNITNNTQASSILTAKLLGDYYRDITVTKTKVLKTQTVDTLFREQSLEPEKYDLLYMDLQGAELLALRLMRPVYCW